MAPRRPLLFGSISHTTDPAACRIRSITPHAARLSSRETISSSIDAAAAESPADTAAEKTGGPTGGAWLLSGSLSQLLNKRCALGDRVKAIRLRPSGILIGRISAGCILLAVTARDDDDDDGDVVRSRSTSPPASRWNPRRVAAVPSDAQLAETRNCVGFPRKLVCLCFRRCAIGIF